MEPEHLVVVIPWLIGAIIIEGIALTLLTFLVLRSKGVPPIIEEVFAVFEDGLLIKHVSNRTEDDDNNLIISGMLTAVQNFINDSFHSRDSSDVKKIEFGEKSILFEREKNIYLAVVYTGDVTNKMRARIMDSIHAIEKEYGGVLDKWNGETSKLEGVQGLIEPLLDLDSKVPST